jgi:hypothetical protein
MVKKSGSCVSRAQAIIEGRREKDMKKPMQPLPPENNKFVTSSDAIKKVEGKLLGMVEALGLEAQREKAVKAIVRQDVWSLDRVLMMEELFKKVIEPITTTYYPAEDVKSSKELGWE